MTAKAALVKALLDGRTLNVKNCFNTIGLTNCSREISRLVVQPFKVKIEKIPRTGTSRYGQPVMWCDYKLNKTPENKEAILKMREYLAENMGEYRPKEKESVVHSNNQGLTQTELFQN